MLCPSPQVYESLPMSPSFLNTIMQVYAIDYSNQQHNMQPGDRSYPRAEDLQDKADDGDVVHDLDEQV